MELCLFAQPNDATESQRVDLSRDGSVWRAHLPEIGPGQAYGYRVHGPSAPAQGHRFNPSKLLLDPYAKAISRSIPWSDVLSGHTERTADPERDLIPDTRDSAGATAKALVVDTRFDWESDRRLSTPWQRTLIYECHVKAMTKLHPGVPERLRGTYLGLATDPIIEHLTSLGVTAIQLLPVQHMFTDRRLAELGLTNYWGYSSIGFFAPDIRFASNRERGEQVSEFKSMVKRFHQAGIEVLLDVVYNHTGEGNQLGPTLSFRGLENSAYYRLNPENRRLYTDFTGCGNTVDLRHPFTRQLVLDSMKYWVEEMHVDGFRFDIAPVLGREDPGFNPRAEFFRQVAGDPALSRIKLIAEPWDLGPEGYQAGRFPAGWSEWNGKFRDSVRRFWRGDPAEVGELASRLTGSSDLYQPGGRTPGASINLITCHDGFTLQDLVSYESKHNLANGEDNRDGTDQSYSRNWGVEGPTEAPNVIRIRERTKRNLLATLALSQGVPMLSHGDELGRTQAGNNNAYCQDSSLTWIDWNLSPANQELLEFTRRIFALRRDNPALRRQTYFREAGGRRGGAERPNELIWLRAEGGAMTPAEWEDPSNHLLGMLLGAAAADETDPSGNPITGDPLLLLLNGGGRTRPFKLPSMDPSGAWIELISTSHRTARAVASQDSVNLGPHSLLLLRHAAGA